MKPAASRYKGHMAIVKTFTARIGNIWSDLTEIEAIITVVSTASAIVENSTTGSPAIAKVVTGAFATLSTIGLIIQKALQYHADAQSGRPPA